MGSLYCYAPRNPALAGLGAIAYTLGLRHAFDADHIAAIDNTTRKLLPDGKRPIGVGFFFSLGHSTVVFGSRDSRSRLDRELADPDVRALRRVHRSLRLGGVPLLIGILNLIVLLDILRVYRMKSGRYDDEQLEETLLNQGFMSRFFLRP